MGRARDGQGLVNRLRATGHVDFVANVLTSAAAAADDAAMGKVARTVARIIGDDMVKAEEKAPSVDTFKAISEQWFKGELHTLYPDDVERKRSAAQDKGNLRRYAFPVIGHLRPDQVTLDHYQQILREIDSRSTRKKAKLSPSTRRQIGQVVRHVLELAVYPLRLITVNPIPASALPRKKPGPVQQFVYPDEDALFMRDTRADLGYRVLFGFLHRQGVRRADALG